MNEHLTKQTLDDHFRYFHSSLSTFSSRYLPLVFPHPEMVEQHVAYICPLCVSNYILLVRRGVFASSEFTLDHFPPESVGGKSKILTCKKCNNEAGAFYESELLKKMHYVASATPSAESHYKTSTKISGLPGNYTSLFKKIEDGKFLLDFPEKLKKKAPFLKQWIDTGSKNPDWEIKLNIKRPDDKKVAKALLKAAYLTCFVNWGYDFVFHQRANELRKILQDSEEDPIDLVPFWVDDLSTKKVIPLGLCVIEHPADMKSIVVNIQLEIKGYSSVASVAIPFADKDGWEKIKGISRSLKDNPTPTITFTRLQPSLLAKILDGYSTHE